MTGTIRRATAAEWDAIKQLLSAAELPVEDLNESACSLFQVYADGSQIAGVIALQPSDDGCAMLRSLAVAPVARDRGIGRALVASAETRARTAGTRRIFLLTTTAEHFFSRLGYERADRDEAPASIKAHQQFRTLCPASAAFMRKQLPP